MIGYLVLDRLLEQKLHSSSPPIYISQWRLLMNKTVNKDGTSFYMQSDVLEKAICAYRKQLETSDTPNTVAVCMEWLLLQCVCDQARRELMEAVYLYLTKTTKDQA